MKRTERPDPVMARQLKFSEALREAQDLCMAADPTVYIMGLGVPDPKGVFGTTVGLREKHGDERVLDMPLAENAMTGVALGSALSGMRPILTHQRVDFALVAMEQMLNQAAKWFYMFGGQQSVPMVVRMIIGRGWGQGPQHSQSLQSLFAHIPGLKVVMPTTAHDAKGLLIAAIEDNNPVIFMEHRWLYGVSDYVPEGMYRVPLGSARIMREGSDVTLVAVSYMALEALNAAEMLYEQGISAEVIDLRSLRPLDGNTVLESVRKTGRLVAIDTSWKSFGVAGEIVALAAECAFETLKAAPCRIALPDCPTPTSPALAAGFYPRAPHIVQAVLRMLGKDGSQLNFEPAPNQRLDQPDPGFTGPF